LTYRFKFAFGLIAKEDMFTQGQFKD